MINYWYYNFLAKGALKLFSDFFPGIGVAVRAIFVGFPLGVFNILVLVFIFSLDADNDTVGTFMLTFFIIILSKLILIYSSFGCSDILVFFDSGTSICCSDFGVIFHLVPGVEFIDGFIS